MAKKVPARRRAAAASKNVRTRSKAKTKAKTKGTRTAKRKTGARAPLTFAKNAVTIRFANERDLADRLRQLLSLFEDTAGAAFDVSVAAAAADAAAPCISLVNAAQIVVAALNPKKFSPPEKLGTTYLIPQERQTFRQRVVNGVAKKNCQIAPTDVPADESTTHGAVVSAVHAKAR